MVKTLSAEPPHRFKFPPTWSCVSLPRSTTSSAWKLLRKTRGPSRVFCSFVFPLRDYADPLFLLASAQSVYTHQVHLVDKIQDTSNLHLSRGSWRRCKRDQHPPHSKTQYRHFYFKQDEYLASKTTSLVLLVHFLVCAFLPFPSFRRYFLPCGRRSFRLTRSDLE